MDTNYIFDDNEKQKVVTFSSEETFYFSQEWSFGNHLSRNATVLSVYKAKLSSDIL